MPSMKLTDREIFYRISEVDRGYEVVQLPAVLPHLPQQLNGGLPYPANRNGSAPPYDLPVA